MKRRWSTFLIVLALVNVGVLLAMGADRHVGGPNVLLVTIDTCRADSIHCLGGQYPTPHVDALAARGIACERGYSQADATPESHLSLMTSRHLADIYQRTPSTSYPMLAEVLHGAGYRTGAVVSATVVDQNVPLVSQPRPLQFGLGIDDFVPLDAQTLRRKGRETTDLALHWIDERAAGVLQRPWFLWVHYYDMHGPLELPNEWKPSEQSYGAQYGQASRYVDTLIGDLDQRLQETGMDRHTIVVVTGDHGESLGEHGLPRSHAGLYDTITRVPLIVALPNGPHGERLAAPAENIDIAPTILAAAGIAKPPSMLGQDLAGLLSSGGRTAVAQTACREGRMVTDGRWKLIEYDTDLRVPREWLSDAVAPGLREYAVYRPQGTRELYNLHDDPAESRNLLAQEPAVAQRLRRVLDAATRSGAANATRDPELEERLKSLGY